MLKGASNKKCIYQRSLFRLTEDLDLIIYVTKIYPGSWHNPFNVIHSFINDPDLPVFYKMDIVLIYIEQKWDCSKSIQRGEEEDTSYRDEDGFDHRVHIGVE